MLSAIILAASAGASPTCQVGCSGLVVRGPGLVARGPGPGVRGPGAERRGADLKSDFIKTLSSKTKGKYMVLFGNKVN